MRFTIYDLRFTNRSGAVESDAEAIAVETLRDDLTASCYAKRLEYGAFTAALEGNK